MRKWIGVGLGVKESGVESVCKSLLDEAHQRIGRHDVEGGFGEIPRRYEVGIAEHETFIDDRVVKVDVVVVGVDVLIEVGGILVEEVPWDGVVRRSRWVCRSIRS